MKKYRYFPKHRSDYKATAYYLFLLYPHGVVESGATLKMQSLLSIRNDSSYFSFTFCIQDKDFGKAPMHRAHLNPSAEVSTTLKIYQRFSLDRAYMGETHFWAFIPHAGDVVLFKFTPPIKIEK